MDIASLIGLIAGIFVFVIGMGGPQYVPKFINLQSIVIVIVGTFSALLIAFPMKKVLSALKAFTLVLKESRLNEGVVINKIIELSNVARKEGLLALEETANALEEEFLKKGVLLIVDGTDPELVRSILETELTFLENRHKDTQNFWDSVAAYGPAWGMIGTVLGLILLLGDLSNPASIGPLMSVTLITTFYGSFLANYLGIPIASKLRQRSAAEILLKEVMIEGLLSIQAGENPRVIEEKLKAFLSPSLRKGLVNSEADEKAGA